MKAISASMQPNEDHQRRNAAQRSLRGTCSQIKPLIAAMKPNEAYSGLMKLNQAHQRRNAEAL